MSHLRAAARLAAMLALSLALLPLALLVSLSGAAFGRRARARALRILPHFTRLWSRANLALIGVRIDAPELRLTRSVLITSNHLSYLDILVLGALLPSRFVAKREIASWPLVGTLTRTVGTIFLQPGLSRDVARLGPELRETLAAGISVVLFPEGGISDGTSVRTFHGALLETAVQEGIACLPVCLHYEVSNPLASPAHDVCWASQQPLLAHFWRLLRLGRIEARLRAAPVPLTDTDRKRLAARLHSETLKLFEPIRRGPAPLRR